MKDPVLAIKFLCLFICLFVILRRILNGLIGMRLSEHKFIPTKSEGIVTMGMLISFIGIVSSILWACIAWIIE
jgi:hypothetical protein